MTDNEEVENNEEIDETKPKVSVTYDDIKVDDIILEIPDPKIHSPETPIIIYKIKSKRDLGEDFEHVVPVGDIIYPSKTDEGKGFTLPMYSGHNRYYRLDREKLNGFIEEMQSGV